MKDSNNLFMRNSSFDYELNDRSIEERAQVKSHEKKYKPKSKFRFILRVILIAGIFILIPLEATGDKQLYTMELKKIFPKIEDMISPEKLKSTGMHGFFNFLEIFIHKDFFVAINIILYNVFHPVLTLKIIYSSTISYYFLVLIRCIYQGKSPSWELKEPEGIIHCTSSFSIPSSSLYLYTFYFFYSFVNYRNVYHPKEKGKIEYRYGCGLKIILFLLFAAILITEIIFMLFYKIHYLVDMIFTLCISIFAISLFIDFDNKIQSFTYTRLKTVFKIRKNKIKIFLYTLGYVILATIIYNFLIQKGDIAEVYEKLANSDQCTRIQREELGLKSTFADIPYIFCYLGAFWGVSLPIEHGVNLWWIPRKDFRKDFKIDIKFILKLIVRVILSIAVGFGLWTAFYFIPEITYEFEFGLDCIKYFLIYFICFGVLPLLFKKICLISETDNASHDSDKNLLFRASIFGDAEAPRGKLMPDDSVMEKGEANIMKEKKNSNSDKVIKTEKELSEGDEFDFIKDDIKNDEIKNMEEKSIFDDDTTELNKKDDAND